MSLLSLLVKNGSKALGYGKRIAKVTPEFLLGDTSEIIGKAMKAQSGSIWQKGKAGFRALENYNNAQTGNFFSRVWKNLKSTPRDLAQGYKTAAQGAKSLGKSGLWAGIKGTGKALAKKMPLIGAVLTIGLELPNIIGAFKDGGFKAGMKEIGGAGVELGGMAAGAAVGSCFGPVGTVVGGIVGGIVGMFVRGKTHSEKKAEQEAAAQEQQAQLPQYSDAEVKALKEYGFSEEEIGQLQAAGYTIDDINNAIQQEIKAMEDAYQQEQAQLEAMQQTPVQAYEPAYNPAYDPVQTYAQLQQGYDPTQAYQYNNLNTTQPLGFNNPYNQAYMNANSGYKYANDIYFQKLFGPSTQASNPFDSSVNNTYQYYV